MQQTINKMDPPNSSRKEHLFAHDFPLSASILLLTFKPLAFHWFIQWFEDTQIAESDIFEHFPAYVLLFPCCVLLGIVCLLLTLTPLPLHEAVNVNDWSTSYWGSSMRQVTAWMCFHCRDVMSACRVDSLLSWWSLLGSAADGLNIKIKIFWDTSPCSSVDF
jgi:hypothetical protein